MGIGHYKYFRVKNFKRFKDLEVKDIGQYNLVLGDNNVGKTSFLEALLWEPHIEHFGGGLLTALKFRNINGSSLSDAFKWFLNVDEYDINNVSLNFEVDIDGKNLHFNYDFNFYLSEYKILSNYLNESLNKPKKLGNVPLRDISLIPFSHGYANDLVENYSRHVQKDRNIKRETIRSLQKLHRELEDIEISISELTEQPGLICYFKNSNKAVPFPFLGEGVIKLFRILVEIINNNGQQVMVDEIDTGIHYTRMKDFWQVILETAQENNVQLFASTHNKECLEAFQDAIEALGNEYISNSRTITLKESPKTGQVNSYTNHYEVLENALEMGNDLR